MAVFCGKNRVAGVCFFLILGIWASFELGVFVLRIFCPDLPDSSDVPPQINEGARQFSQMEFSELLFERIRVIRR